MAPIPKMWAEIQRMSGSDRSIFGHSSCGNFRAFDAGGFSNEADVLGSGGGLNHRDAGAGALAPVVAVAGDVCSAAAEKSMDIWNAGKAVTYQPVRMDEVVTATRAAANECH